MIMCRFLITRAIYTNPILSVGLSIRSRLKKNTAMALYIYISILIFMKGFNLQLCIMCAVRPNQVYTYIHRQIYTNGKSIELYRSTTWTTCAW